ncbi:hypothetical protein [Xylella taiwanensis]|uniref:hypothetical protein n=1 Tax=Xylella taiwanensis TaxID=1444770 RepID=UPI0004BB2421
MARADIQRQPETLKCDELAIVGLVLGWLVVMMMALIFLILMLFCGGLAWFIHLSS